MSFWTAYGIRDSEAAARVLMTSQIRFHKAVKAVPWGNKWIVYVYGRLKETV